MVAICLTFNPKQLVHFENQQFPQSAKKIPQQLYKVMLHYPIAEEGLGENKTENYFIQTTVIIFKF